MQVGVSERHSNQPPLPFVCNQTLTGDTSEQRPLFDVCPTRVLLAPSIGQTTRLRARLTLYVEENSRRERASERTHCCALEYLLMQIGHAHIHTAAARETRWMDEEKRREEDVSGNQGPLHVARSTSAVLQFSRKAGALKAS